MTHWLPKASIRRKLTVLIAGTTAITLLLASMTFAIAGLISFRRSLDQKLTIMAEILGRNSTAALAFGDKKVARDVLATLDAERSIESAAVFDRSGRLVAQYVSKTTPGVLPTSTAGLTSEDAWGRLQVVHPIVLDGEMLGTVYLQSSMIDITQRMELLALLTLGTIIVCSGVAIVLSSKLQTWISGPIVELAHTARMITAHRNFALRVEADGSDDEVGLLVQDFNRMLADIEQQDHQLRQQQESLTEQVANRTVALVQANAQLKASVERVESYAEQIGQLTALSHLLQSCLMPEEVFSVIQDAMPRLFPDDSGAVTILKASGNVMEAMAMWGNNPPRQRVFEPEECWAFRRGRPHFVTSLTSPLRCAHLTPEDGPTTFCVPMMAQGDNVGIVQFNFTQEDPSEAPDETGLVQSARARIAAALAEHTALSLANLRLRAALRSQSIIDSLTGLYNRRYLESALERECRRLIRARRPLTILMIDIDHFKQFNDTWGHEGGDVVLREFGSLLRAHFRGEDVACRFGGEEFIVLLAEARIEDAFRRAEDLRQEVRQLTAEHHKQPLGSISISVGVAALPEHGITPEDLISAADRALYEAKRAGRDRTVCAQLSHAAARVEEAGLA
jgi:diguanylate cyclase (GGDEF)-like protein